MTDHDPPGSSTGTFNLIDEPWIPVIDLDGAEVLVSIKEALRDSHRFRDITGELPTVRFSILRILLPIIYRALDEEADDPLLFWSELWNQDTLPSELMDPYLDRWHHRFDLLSPTEPFMQVPDLRTPKDEWKPVDLIVADVDVDSPLFTRRSELESLSYPEAARWLIHANSYDYSGIKSGVVGDPRVKGGKAYPLGVGWAGWLGGIALTGRTLRETLLLNYIAGLTDMLPGDLPIWEHPVLAAGFREVDQIGEVGPLHLMTWPQRRLRLRSDDERITGVVLSNGDALDYTMQWTNETMSGWRFSVPQSTKARAARYMARTFSSGEALWRGLNTLIPHGELARLDGKSMKKWNVDAAAEPAAVIDWLGKLTHFKVLDAGYVVEVSAVSMEYGSQMASYAEVVSDRLSFAAALADLAANATLLELAQTAVNRTDKAVKALRYLAQDLDSAAGGDGSGVGETAEERAYAEFDQSFRRWLLSVAPGCDGERLLDEWTREIRSSIQRRASALVESSPPSAWLGHAKDTRGDVLNVPSVINKFDRNLYFALGSNSANEQEDKND